MNTKKLRYSRYSLIALALSAPVGVVQAGDNYLTLGSGSVGTGPSSFTPLLKTFTLPAGTYVGVDAKRNAVLQLEVSGQSNGIDEAYLNSPVTTCTAQVGDPSQPWSLATINNGFNHMPITSNKLKVGLNTLMFCARNNAGSVVAPLDDYNVIDIVLHYQTN